MRASLTRCLAWTLALAISLPASAHGAGPRAAPPAALAKIDPAVLSAVARGAQTEFILVLAEQADLSAAAFLPSRAAKGRYVYETLTETAARAQRPLLQQLAALGAPARPFYIVNAIAVRGGLPIVEALALNPLVARIEPDPPVRAVLPEPQPAAAPAPLAAGGIEWNVAQVNAPAAWGRGYIGQGVVVANQDTGFQWDHPALLNQYRGWDGMAADHNFHWWDAIHADLSGDNGNPCGFSAPAPCADGSHGTHTLGTAVGADDQGNQIGVAPGAQWIGCRNMDSGVGRPSTYIECFEFFLAPWDLNGQNADPALAPDVINNSWYCPESEQCTGTSLLATVENVRAAGILVVAAAGNFGPDCGTVKEEPGTFAAAFSVGATDSAGQIASFSSRGPVTVDGSQRLKPDLSAPGVNVRSSTAGGAYGLLSGTSMAAPHVAGAAALLLSAQPKFGGDVARLEQRLLLTAAPLASPETCGAVPGSSRPNNTFGWGLLDAYAAVAAELYYLPTVLQH